MTNSDLNKAQQFIKESQRITLLCSPQFQKDSFPASLALFYTLKDLGKDVNLPADNWPKRFAFLVEEGLLENGQRNDLVITVKGAKDKADQFFYEKTENGDLKLVLKTKNNGLAPEELEIKTMAKQSNKKEASPEDLLITLGVSSLKEASQFLEEPASPIINIDNQLKNEKHGEVNLINKEAVALSEIVFDLICLLRENTPLGQKTAEALTAGIIHASNNLQKTETTGQTLQKLSCLVEEGVSLKSIKNQLYGQISANSLALFSKVLNKIKINQENNLATVNISDACFKETNSSPADLKFVLRKLTSGLFPFQNLLVLWEQVASPLQVKGVFYSSNNQLIEKILQEAKGQQKGEAAIFTAKEKTLEQAQKQLLVALEK